MINKDNWLSWSIDGVPLAKRIDKNSVCQFHINITDSSPVRSYQEELYNNGRAARDYFNEPFDVLFSGGIDSEVIIRVFKDLKIKHNTYIFKYENDYNIREMSAAIETAKSLGIEYKIVDFNLQKFFENDAYDLFKRSGCIRAGRLVHLALCDRVDNIPVLGEGEPYWWRDLGGDYSKKSEWHFPITESNHNVSMYMHFMGRPNLCDWYEFTPNVIRAFNRHATIQGLINDRIYGKQSSWTSRVPMHREIWPDITPKMKMIGYEGDQPSGTYPQFMIDFQKVMEDEIGAGTEYWYKFDDFEKLFRG